MKTELPVRAASFARRHPELWKAFENLADECHKAGPLDAKTRRLIDAAMLFGHEVDPNRWTKNGPVFRRIGSRLRTRIAHGSGLG